MIHLIVALESNEVLSAWTSLEEAKESINCYSVDCKIVSMPTNFIE